MIEINELCIDRQTMNTGYIFFDNSEKATQWRQVLEDLYIPNVIFVNIIDGKRYYGFRMFRMKKRFFKLCVCLKEVVG